jgi:arylsulfatase A-like enzyme/CubicO group peptidase (beta-lactamase class C family)
MFHCARCVADTAPGPGARPADPLDATWRIDPELEHFMVRLDLKHIWLMGLVIALTSAGSQPAAARGQSAGAADPAQRRPNILMILTDDMDLRLDSLDYMPNVKRLLTAQGTTFGNYYIADSLCCPSRSTILRSQYVHNHKVYTNLPPTGGYEQFFPLGHERSNLGTWLAGAGYTTAFLGKYLNGYPLPNDKAHLPPGWTDWYSPAGGTPYASFNYTLNENGKLVNYGGAAEDQITDVLAGKADDFLHRHAGQAAPFFVYLAPYAPHKPADPAPRHANLFPNVKVPRVPSYDEADVSDKPKVIQDRARLAPRLIQQMDALYRTRLQSLQAVDEMVARLVATLEATGELTRTYVIFTSDNGYHMGHHRMPDGKMTAYEEDIRVPLIVRGPGVPAGKTLAGYLTGNVDLAPTFAAIAGVQPPDFVDGRSLVPLLSAAPPAPSAWRQAYLVEQYPFGTGARAGEPPPLLALRRSLDLLGVLEPADGMDREPRAAAPDQARPVQARSNQVAPNQVAPNQGAPDQTTPDQTTPAATYIALRTLRYTYVEYDTGERELYDNDADPYQLDNQASKADPALLASLSTWVRQLHTCQAAGCRTAEQTQPSGLTPTPGGTPAPSPTPTRASSPAATPTAAPSLESTPTTRPAATATPQPTVSTALPTAPLVQTATPAAPATLRASYLPITFDGIGSTDLPTPGSTRAATPATPTSGLPRATSTEVPARPTATELPSPTTTPLRVHCDLAAAYNAANQGVSFLVMLDGQAVCEDYPNGGGVDKAPFLASGTKSFWGVAAAVAAEEGLLSLDEKVADTLTEWRSDAQRAKMTIRHLLSLTSGMDPGKTGQIPTYADALLSPMLAEPGTRFAYGPVPYQVFGELLRRKLLPRGQDPVAYLDAKVLGPIGARHASWRRGADGNPNLPSGAAFSAREWVKFGELVRLRGLWNGVQIVPSARLDACFTGSAANPNYGLTWWLAGGDGEGGSGQTRPAAGVPADMVYAAGAGKQRMYVIRSAGVVAVRQTPKTQDAGFVWSDAEFINRLLHGTDAAGTPLPLARTRQPSMGGPPPSRKARAQDGVPPITRF